MPPTDDELAQLPHALVTSDEPWDPHSLDSEPDDLHYFNAEMVEGIAEDWVELSDDYAGNGKVHNCVPVLSMIVLTSFLTS